MLRVFRAIFAPRRLKKFALFLVVLCVLKGIWYFNFVLSGDELLSERGRIDLLERRAHLIARVATDTFGPQDMPRFIPSPFREELTIATLSMTTVALTNLAFRFPETREESLAAINRMIERMLTPEIRKFEMIWWGQDALESLDRNEGQIGYLGHLNLMLGCSFILGGDDKYVDLFKRISAALARRLFQSPSFHAETFPGMIFTADNTTVIVSLRLYDYAFSGPYEPLIRQWIDYTGKHLLDSESGLVRYYVDSSGRAYGTARGVLQAWNSMFLPNIEEGFAKFQYSRMRELLVDRKPFGLIGVREYPKMKTGPTDIISGPIIFGVSTAATGFAIGGAVIWRDDEALTGLLRTSELFGWTVSWGGKRSYLFAPLVGEAILLAAKSMYRWDSRYVVWRPDAAHLPAEPSPDQPANQPGAKALQSADQSRGTPAQPSSAPLPADLSPPPPLPSPAS